MIALPAFITRAMAHFEKVENLLVAKEEISAAKTTIETQTAELETLRADVTRMTKELETTNANASAFEVKIKALESTINDPAGEIEKRSQLKALEIAAGQGIPPIPPEKKPDAPGKLDVSGLFGREKFIAIEKAERAARNHRN